MQKPNRTLEVLGVELSGSPKIADIVRSVSVVWGLTPGEIRSKRRTREIVRAKFQVFALGSLTGLYSSTLIGRHTGGYDHSSVIHGVNRAIEWSRQDPEYRERMLRAWDIATNGPEAIMAARIALEKSREAERAMAELKVLKARMPMQQVSDKIYESRELGVWSRTQLDAMHEAHRLSLIAAGGEDYDGGRIEL